MTELERQLTTALRALSEEYETAQQQHCEEQRRHSELAGALQRRIEQQDAESGILRQQVEQHAAQVEALTAACRAAQRANDALGPGLRGRLAATLRELWS